MRIRRSSRLILLDTESRVLLFRIEDATVFRADELPAETYWITPGGSLESGEDHAAAALRELWEETGMTGIELGLVAVAGFGGAEQKALPVPVLGE